MGRHGETRNEVYQEVSDGRSEEPVDINVVSRKAKAVNKHFSEMNNKLCLHVDVTRVSKWPHQRGTIAAPFDSSR